MECLVVGLLFTLDVNRVKSLSRQFFVPRFLSKPLWGDFSLFSISKTTGSLLQYCVRLHK